MVNSYIYPKVASPEGLRTGCIRSPHPCQETSGAILNSIEGLYFIQRQPCPKTAACPAYIQPKDYFGQSLIYGEHGYANMRYKKQHK